MDMDRRLNGDNDVPKTKNIKTQIRDDVDYSEEDRGKPLSFKTTHKYSLFIPSPESCSHETHTMIINTLIDTRMKDLLEKSGIINYQGGCSQLLPLKAPGCDPTLERAFWKQKMKIFSYTRIRLLALGGGLNCNRKECITIQQLTHSSENLDKSYEESLDFLDVISLLMWGIPDSQLFLRGILYLTVCNDRSGKFVTTFQHHRNKRGEELKNDHEFEAHQQNAWCRFKRFAKHGEVSAKEKEFFSAMALFILANNLKRPVIVLTDKEAHLDFIGGVYLPLERTPSECFKNPLIVAYLNGMFVPLVIQENTERNNIVSLMRSFSAAKDFVFNSNDCLFSEDDLSQETFNKRATDAETCACTTATKGSEKMLASNRVVKKTTSVYPVRFASDNETDCEIIKKYMDVSSDGGNGTFCAKYNSDPSSDTWNPVFSAMMPFNNYRSYTSLAVRTEKASHLLDKGIIDQTVSKAAAKPRSVDGMASKRPLCNETLQKRNYDQNTYPWMAENECNEMLANNILTPSVQCNKHLSGCDVQPRTHTATPRQEFEPPPTIAIAPHRVNHCSCCPEYVQHIHNPTHASPIGRPFPVQHIIRPPPEYHRTRESGLANTHDALYGAFSPINRVSNNIRTNREPMGQRAARKCITPFCEMYGLPETGDMCSKCLKDYTITNNVQTRHLAHNRQRPFSELPTTHLDLSIMNKKCATNGCRYHCSVYTQPYCHECIGNMNVF